MVSLIRVLVATIAAAISARLKPNEIQQVYGKIEKDISRLNRGIELLHDQHRQKGDVIARLEAEAMRLYIERGHLMREASRASRVKDRLHDLIQEAA